MTIKSIFIAIPFTVCFTVLCVIVSDNAMADTDALDTITIEEERLSESYLLPFTELPHTIHNVELETVQTNNSTRIEDVVATLPGVLVGRSQAGISSSLIIRGFSLNANAYLDGLQDNKNHMIRDLATIERIEIGKGNDSVHFGSGSPSGTLNYISKKTQSKQATRLKLHVADPLLLRSVFDRTGSMGQRNDMAYRLIIAAQDGKRFKENVDDDRVLIAPSLRWDYSDSGSVLFSSELNYQNHTFDFDNVAINGDVIYNVSYVDPRTKAHRRSAQLGMDLQQDLNPSTTFHLKANYHKGNRDDLLVGFLFQRPTEAELVGYYRKLNDQYNQYTLQPQLETSWTTGQTKHTFKIGLESKYYRSNVDSEESIGAFTLNPYAPVFDYPLPTTNLLLEKCKVTSREKAFFLVDNMQIGNKTTITFGMRHSEFSQTFEEKISNRKSTQADNKNNAFSIGINYKLLANTALFAHRTESFEPNIGTDRNQQFFKPKKGIQYEIGLRLNSLNKQWSLQTSIYDLTQSNLTTTDPVDQNSQALLGQRQVKGLELQATRHITPSMKTTLAYSYMDGKITQNNDGLRGNTSRNTPRHSGTLALDYTFSTGLLSGLATNLSMHYVDQREGDNANSFKVPSYTVTHLSLRHPIKKQATLTASIQNLFDKDYVSASFDKDTIRQGDKRSITFGVDYRF